MGICVEVAENRRLAEWLAVRNELEPDEPLRLEQLLARRAAEPQRQELIATVEGEIAGVGSVGPKGSPFDLAYGYIGVPEGWKQRGVESALLAELRRIAETAGRSRLELWADEDDQGLMSLLEGQRFREVMREGGLALELADLPALEAQRLPHGVTLEPVESRPDLGDAAYELAAQTWPDIPGETGIENRETWLRLNLAGAPAGALVALDAGHVIGFAGLHQLAAAGLFEHGLLAVHRDYRRRGIARAMKVAQLLWLREHAARRVVTWNAETNTAARTLNLSLGYKPLPATIAFHGPV